MHRTTRPRLNTNSEGSAGKRDVQKLVVAHHIVGNTQSYSVSDWEQDISLAASKGIDGFALNMGADSWSAPQVANAFTAAVSAAPAFRLFFSFDMTSFPCGSQDNAQTLRGYISQYAGHPAYLQYGGGALVSTFGGEYCSFGTGSLNDAWTSVVRGGPGVHFVPAFFVDPSMFSSLPVIDGAFNWNAGWPSGDFDINFDPDNSWISKLGGKMYMAPVSPWFFTHYGPNSYNKNFIYRGDDWLLAERFELLMQNRDSVAIAQVLTWNDFGESHYVGPEHGSLSGSDGWTSGYDHTGWLNVIQYYAAAFKTGTYPAVSHDTLVSWARLSPAGANAPDPVAKPSNWQWTSDVLWTVAFLSAPATVTLSCGSSSASFNLGPGASKIQMALGSSGDCSASARATRAGVVSAQIAPQAFRFTTNPQSYNFNAFVVSS